MVSNHHEVICMFILSIYTHTSTYTDTEHVHNIVIQNVRLIIVH